VVALLEILIMPPIDAHPTSYLNSMLSDIEKRTSPRMDYNCRQWVAPRYEDRAPLRREFFAVECRDISRGGVSFVLDWEPDFRDVVVALGPVDAPEYLAAKVARVTPVEDDGEPVYIVGCEFTGRMQL